MGAKRAGKRLKAFAPPWGGRKPDALWLEPCRASRLATATEAWVVLAGAGPVYEPRAEAPRARAPEAIPATTMRAGCIERLNRRIEGDSSVRYDVLLLRLSDEREPDCREASICPRI
jgi:hypothetical protein